MNTGKGRDANSSTTTNNNNTSTLQQILGPEAEIFSLTSFLERHVHNLPHWRTTTTTSQEQDDILESQLQTTLVSPFLPIPALEITASPLNAESLSSLVDHVIFSLTQRREQHKRQQRLQQKHYQNKSNQQQIDGRNLLCQGFVVASEDLVQQYGGPQSMRHMPSSAVVMMQLNTNVDYIKTQPLFRFLHIWVGDTVLRTILMTCRIFIPLVANRDGSGGDNYLQLTGPPLPLRRIHVFENNPNGTKISPVSSLSTRKRKRPQQSQTALPTETTTTNKNVSAPHLRPSATIRKDPLLHSNAHVPHIGLPSNHILQTCTHPKQLLTDIMVGGNNGPTEKPRVPKKRWKRIRHQGMAVGQQMMTRHHKCDYARLLQHYCPLSTEMRMTTTERKDDLSLDYLSAAYSSKDAVTSFVKSVVKHVFPPQVWGSVHNQDCMMQLIHTFVHARRQEHLTNTQILNGVRIKEVEWVRCNGGGASTTSSPENNHKKKKFSRSDHDATKQLVLLLFRWTLEQFVIPLLNSCFHVTETEFAGKQLVYYRKPVWALFRSMSLKKLLNSQYSELSPAQAATRLDGQSMGFSRLRLVPKETGVRPIATLSKAAQVSLNVASPTSLDPLEDDNALLQMYDGAERPTKRRKLVHNAVVKKTVQQYSKPSTNSQLQEAFAVLRSEYENETSLFGSGLDGLHHFYPRYRKFLSEIKAQAAAHKNTRLVFGSVDIRHCFDSINQEEMVKIVESVLKKTDYCIQNHSQYRPFESMSRLLRLKKTRVCRPEDLRPFPVVAEEMALSSHKTVYADMVHCSVAKKPQILSLVDEHLKSHLVVTADRVGDRYLLQSTGVPQGSTLSTLLCNFYYGSIEKRLLKDFHKQPPNDHTLLCRQVDDFLFVGTNQQHLEEFLVAMLRGDENLGVEVNEDKTQVSTTVRVHLSSEDSKLLSPQGTRRKFPWCGMLFDVTTGEVMVDYSRFYEDKSGNSISIDRSRGQGEEFLLQLKSFVRPRCIPILYDQSINCLSTQEINFFQMMAFAAIKMTVYMEARSFGVNQKDNLSFVISCIESTIAYAGTLIRSRLDAADARWDIIPSHQTYIGWKAFRSVLVAFGKAPSVIVALDKLKALQVDDQLDRRCQRALRSMEIRKLMA